MGNGRTYVNLHGYVAPNPQYVIGSDDIVADMTALPDGRLFAVGTMVLSSGGGTIDYAGYARLLPDGALDTSLYGVGKGYDFLDDLSADAIGAAGVVAQPDGKVVVAGLKGWTHSPVRYDLFVTRLLGDGNRDTSFGTNGIVVEDLPGLMLAPWSVALEPDGKIAVLATANIPGGGNPQTLVFRYATDGVRDATFGTNGVASPGATYNGSNTKVLAQRSGKLVLVGGVFDGLTVKRLDASGAPDPTFGQAGVVTLAKPGTSQLIPRNAALGPNDDVVVVGDAAVGGYGHAIVFHVGPNGGFAPAGDAVVVDFPPLLGSSGRAAAVQPDGRILLGAVGYGGLYDFELARLVP
jgi:uncharacterized delta-60 repeat protein